MADAGNLDVNEDSREDASDDEVEVEAEYLGEVEDEDSGEVVEEEADEGLPDTPMVAYLQKSEDLRNHVTSLVAFLETKNRSRLSEALSDGFDMVGLALMKMVCKKADSLGEYPCH